ncbi:MAG: alpha/beta fold hydrolase BchO [Myxococcota bacterium]
MNEPDPDWPNRELSRLVEIDAIRWHVQVGGKGPAVLLLHGTGSSSHSFRDALPALVEDMTVIAPDLPGHGFSRASTSVPRTLPAMARALTLLLQSLELRPGVIVGHSAGAAIGAQMALDGHFDVHTLVSVNGALTPFTGVARVVLPAMARAFAKLNWPARRIARDARRPRAVDRMLGGTGSLLDPRGRELYTRLVQREEHVRGTVAMTAAWDLSPLAQQLHRLPCALVAVSGSRDKTVRPDRARRVAAEVPHGSFVDWAGLGHLAHEEDPKRFVELVLSVAKDHGDPSPTHR